MAGPLTHIRVLDLTRVLAGPWCAQNLADLGAEVIKVERPKKGDDSRAFGPPWLKDENGKDTTEAGYFLSANRGKKSITIDIASEAGAALVKELAKTADVFLENFKVGDLASKGLGYDDLKAINPGIIYCSITGFGQTGPYATKPGYDFMIQGMGGFMSVTGERDQKPGGGPQRAGVPVVDIMTGMYSTIAVCAAIAHRERTGNGQHIDCNLLDTQVGFLANQGANFLVTGEPPVRLGNTHPNIVPVSVRSHQKWRGHHRLRQRQSLQQALRSAGPAGAEVGPALFDQCRPCLQPRRSGSDPGRVDAAAHHRGMGHGPRGRRRAVRTHQQPEAGLREPPGRGSRASRRDSPPHRRHGAVGA